MSVWKCPQIMVSHKDTQGSPVDFKLRVAGSNRQGKVPEIHKDSDTQWRGWGLLIHDGPQNDTGTHKGVPGVLILGSPYPTKRAVSRGAIMAIYMHPIF